eukprot:RCo047830
MLRVGRGKGGTISRDCSPQVAPHTHPPRAHTKAPPAPSYELGDGDIRDRDSTLRPVIPPIGGSGPGAPTATGCCECTCSPAGGLALGLVAREDRVGLRPEVAAAAAAGEGA